MKEDAARADLSHRFTCQSSCVNCYRAEPLLAAFRCVLNDVEDDNDDDDDDNDSTILYSAVVTVVEAAGLRPGRPRQPESVISAAEPEGSPPQWHHSEDCRCFRLVVDRATDTLHSDTGDDSDDSVMTELAYRRTGPTIYYLVILPS